MSSQSNSKKPLPKNISEALVHLEEGVGMLQEAGSKHGSHLKFTLDGRLIGDAGELLAAQHLGITLKNVQQTGYDGLDAQGCQVEIKTTRLDSFAFRKIAQRVICIKIHGTTHWEIVYDGPGTVIANQFPKDAFREGHQQVRRDHPASLKSQRQLAISKLVTLRIDHSALLTKRSA